MLGYYDYTVWLTYLSALSAGLGIIIALYGAGHPYIGMFFLMISGLCDAFDGKVARTKKNRTEMEKKFGIQIDSLADLIAFGVLPACIGNAMLRVCPTMPEIPRIHAENRIEFPVAVLCYAIMLLYILSVLIRLAYFNVSEEERQKKETSNRKYYEGLPVTSSSLVFPTVLLVQYILPADITPIYFVVMVLMMFCYLSRIRIPKPGTKGILGMVAFGALEFALLAFIWKLIR